MTTVPTTFPGLNLFPDSSHFESGPQERKSEFFELETASLSIAIGQSALPVLDITTGQALSSVRIGSIIFSAFALSGGIFDLALFLSTENFLLHPYFDLILIIGGFFLLLTTILALKGK